MPTVFERMNAALIAHPELGRSVTYTPAGGAPETVTAIPTDSLEEPSSPGNVAGLFLKLSDVPNIARGDQFTIDLVSYGVEDPYSDTVGGVKVRLRKNS